MVSRDSWPVIVATSAYEDEGHAISHRCFAKTILLAWAHLSYRNFHSFPPQSPLLIRMP